MVCSPVLVVTATDLGPPSLKWQNITLRSARDGPRWMDGRVLLQRLLGGYSANKRLANSSRA